MSDRASEIFPLVLAYGGRGTLKARDALMEALRAALEGGRCGACAHFEDYGGFGPCAAMRAFPDDMTGRAYVDCGLRLAVVSDEFGCRMFEAKP